MIPPGVQGRHARAARRRYLFPHYTQCRQGRIPAWSYDSPRHGFGPLAVDQEVSAQSAGSPERGATTRGPKALLPPSPLPIIPNAWDHPALCQPAALPYPDLSHRPRAVAPVMVACLAIHRRISVVAPFTGARPPSATGTANRAHPSPASPRGVARPTSTPLPSGCTRCGPWGRTHVPSGFQRPACAVAPRSGLASRREADRDQAK